MFFKTNQIIFHAKWETKNRLNTQIVKGKYLLGFGENTFTFSQQHLNVFVFSRIQRTLKCAKIWKKDLHKFLEEQFQDKVRKLRLRIVNIQMSIDFSLSIVQITNTLIPEIDKLFEIRRIEIQQEVGSIAFCNVNILKKEKPSFITLTISLQDIYPDKEIRLKIVKRVNPNKTCGTIIFSHFSAEFKRFVLFLEQDKWH
jgi:hypothetical protein